MEPSSQQEVNTPEQPHQVQNLVEAGFYHLTRTPMDQALPMLLGRVLHMPARAVIKCSSRSGVKEIDTLLWKSTTPLWLPHGCIGEKHAALNPIWITDGDDVPNQAECLFMLAQAKMNLFEGCKRIFTLFNAHVPNELNWARDVWKALADQENVRRTYWQQGEKGWTAQKQV